MQASEQGKVSEPGEMRVGSIVGTGYKIPRPHLDLVVIDNHYSIVREIGQSDRI